MIYLERNYDVVVIGGGLAGVCAAIASARKGVKTALIQNRPVLGGNASSEVKMHICGATSHGTRKDARETGIVDEIIMRNKRINPQNSFYMLDLVMYEKTRYQENLDLYLNTHVIEVKTDDNEIKRVKGIQMTTEKEIVFQAKIFIDATGDAFVAEQAGAEYMLGRESKDMFNEPDALDKSDQLTMGNSLMFKSKRYNQAIPFEKFDWAHTYNEEDLRGRGHTSNSTGSMENYAVDSGYWWLELGGTQDTIHDGEEIRDEILKTLLGVWDHIKNFADHGASNHALEWVGFLPGKRESRRIVGDYVLKQQDLLECKVFEDAVAYGGWPMDIHPVEGFKHKGKPTTFFKLNDVYTIPYRSFYSKNISNLMMAGRDISATHMAFGSTRVMSTCGVGGQAAGTAAALAVQKGVKPRDVLNHINELQQELLKDDCYIPGFKNEDVNDKALKAQIEASSFEVGFEPENVINGVSRKVHDSENAWKSKPIHDLEWISVIFSQTERINEVRLTFDNNLTDDVMTTLETARYLKQYKGMAKELVKDFDVVLLNGNQEVKRLSIKDNYYRQCVIKVDGLTADQVKLEIFNTHGDEAAKVFEIRCY